MADSTISSDIDLQYFFQQIDEFINSTTDTTKDTKDTNNTTDISSIITLQTQDLSRINRCKIHEYCFEKRLFTLSVPRQDGQSGKQIKVMKKKPELKLKLDVADIHLFVNKMNYPISNLDPSKFNYYLTHLEPYYPGCTKSFELYCTEFYEGANFKQELRKIIDFSKSFIKENEAYQAFMNSKFVVDNNTGHLNKPLYDRPNIGKRFISIDIIKANYTVLKAKCPKIPFPKPTKNVGDHDDAWYQYICLATESEFMRQCKKVRECIFGEIRFSKRASRLQQYYCNDLLHYLHNNHPTIYNQLRVIICKNDEIVVEISDDFDVQQLNKIICVYRPNFFHVEPFRLQILQGTPYYYKEYEIEKNGLKELRHVPKKIYFQMMKLLEKKPIIELDMTFWDMEMNAAVKYLEPVKFI